MDRVYVICIVAVVLFLLAVIAVYTTASSSDLPEYHGYSRFKLKRGVVVIGDQTETTSAYSLHTGLNITYVASLDTTTLESVHSLGYRVVITEGDRDIIVPKHVAHDLIIIVTRGEVASNCTCCHMQTECDIMSTPYTETIHDFDPYMWDALVLSSSIIKHASTHTSPESVLHLASCALIGITGPINFAQNGCSYHR